MGTPVKLVALALLTLAIATESPAQADDYPNKPVRLLSDLAPAALSTSRSGS